MEKIHFYKFAPNSNNDCGVILVNSLEHFYIDPMTYQCCSQGHVTVWTGPRISQIRAVPTLLKSEYIRRHVRRTINTAYSGFVLEFGASLIRSLASDSDHILNILDLASVWFAQPTCWHAYRVPELAHYSVHTTVSIKQCPQQRITYNYTF